ncbi:hypothetical protein KA344_19825 [bacterium]|jgi:hypothetical protein|nr:hypothetical protein [bacterium]
MSIDIEQLDCASRDGLWQKEDKTVSKRKLASLLQQYPVMKEAAQASLDAVSTQYPEITRYWIDLSIDPDADDIIDRCTILFIVPGVAEMSVDEMIDWNQQFIDWWVAQSTFEQYVNAAYWQGIRPSLRGNCKN